MHRLVLLSALAGCVTYDNSTHLIVHDPRSVTVTIHPYEHDYEHSWIERSIDGAIDVWCAACRPVKRKTYTTGRDIVVAGTPAEHLQIDGERVSLHVDFGDRYRCGPRQGRHFPTCWKPALAVELVTPRANVEALRYDHLVAPESIGQGTGLIVLGPAWTALGCLLVGLAIHDHEHAAIRIGIGMLAAGLGVGALGVYLNRAPHDTSTTFAP